MHSLKKFVHIFLLQLGGINSLLAIEHSGHLPLIKDTPTMILGMDVSHGSPGRSDIPSIAAVRLFFFISPIFYFPYFCCKQSNTMLCYPRNTTCFVFLVSSAANSSYVGFRLLDLDAGL